MVDGWKAKYRTTRKGCSGNRRFTPDGPCGSGKTSPVRVQSVGSAFSRFPLPSQGSPSDPHVLAGYCCRWADKPPTPRTVAPRSADTVFGNGPEHSGEIDPKRPNSGELVALVTRYETTVTDGRVLVQGPDGRIPVGDVEEIIDLVGGPSWTISYTEAEKQRYGSLNTADEGITVDVVDTIHAMTFGERFVRTLDAQPAERPDEDPASVSPRLGLFVGRLLENLEYGLR